LSNIHLLNTALHCIVICSDQLLMPLDTNTVITMMMSIVCVFI